MKRAAYILILLLCLLATACKRGGGDYFVLEGQLKGVQEQALYVVGADRRFARVDTLGVNKDGEFRHKMLIDTVMPLYLLLPDGRFIPFFGQNGTTTRIEGNIEHLDSIQISGGEENETMNDFREEYGKLTAIGPLQQAVEQFVTKHPHSEASVQLIINHFINVDHPDNKKIAAVIKKLSGPMQDNPVLHGTLKRIGEQYDAGVGGMFPYFQFTDIHGDTLDTGTLHDEFVLLTFWSSWHRESVEQQVRIKSLRQKLAGKNIVFINYSLDLDPLSWREVVKRDTLADFQVCPYKGWDNPYADRYQIRTLPFNILLNPQKRIEAFNIPLDSIPLRYATQLHKSTNTKLVKKGVIKPAASPSNNQPPQLQGTNPVEKLQEIEKPKVRSLRPVGDHPHFRT